MTVNGVELGEIFCGAVYVAIYGTEEVTVPTVGSPPGTPFTCQITTAFEFCTLAENCSVLPATTLAVVGEILTLGGGGGTIKTLAVPKTNRSVSKMALMVTTAGVGICAGAV